MISLLLAAVLSQTPPASPPAAPIAVATDIPASQNAAVPEVPALTEKEKKAQMAAERQERVGCVVRTGTRIKRKDRDNCAPGSSISKDDIDRAGGILVSPGNAPVPAGAGG